MLKQSDRKPVPLCVDLDGTLIKTDLLFETALLLIRKNVLNLILFIIWLAGGGIANLKRQIALRVNINPATLPYSECFLSYLRMEKQNGRHLALVTASDKHNANLIAEYLGIFSEVIGSNGTINLKGKQKRDILNQKFGIKQYAYAGNDQSDIYIWKDAYSAILVNPSRRVIQKMKSIATDIEKKFSEKEHGIKTFLKLLRIHQYVKNSLIFLPLFTAHLIFNETVLLNSIVAFTTFCLMATSAYLLNDLLDLEADRGHSTKCKRAFAAGNVSLLVGLLLSPLFFILGCLIALSLSKYFLLTALSYYALTIFYSFYFKKKLLMDVFVLAILYTLRIVAGIVVIEGDFSPWLISFSIFLFLSLAYIKRYSELHTLGKENKISAAGRGYHTCDIDQLRTFGTVSGYLSALILALYIHSDKSMLYKSSEFLWIICLILLYWISRIWILASRGELHEDPVVFAIKDKISWIAVFLSGLIGIIATYI